MFRRALLLGAMLSVLPRFAILAQESPVLVTVTASNSARFHLVSDTSKLVAVGTVRFTMQPKTLAAFSVFTQDSLSRVHVEATQNNRVLAVGDGAFVSIRHDTSAVSIEARQHLPSSLAPAQRKP